MTLLEYKRHFKKELETLYSESESAKIFEIFAYEIIGFNRFQFRKFSHQEMLISDVEDFEKIISELKIGKPYQQILGETEFYGMQFFVDENVLIPRPETEELLELALDTIEKSFSEGERFRMRVLDIGTGSGIIPIILKKHFPNTEVFGTDVSEKALEMAKKNAAFHETEIHFLQHDFLHENWNENFDIIISNPPYIGKTEESEIEDSVKNFEPTIALFAPTEDALIFYKKIAEFAQTNLNKNGMIFLEINQKLGPETLDVFQYFQEAELRKDLSGNDRFVVVKF